MGMKLRWKLEFLERIINVTLNSNCVGIKFSTVKSIRSKFNALAIEPSCKVTLFLTHTWSIRKVLQILCFF